MSPRPQRLKAARQKIVFDSLSDLVALFGPWVNLPDSFGSDRRKRLYTAQRTFWAFLGQVFSKGGSCREAVRQLQAWLALQEGPRAASGVASYCKARGRLHLNALTGCAQRVYKSLHERVPPEQRQWCGRPVKVIDGSSVRLPDTPENQKQYPQPTSQAAGCGFPRLYMAALFCLHTGLWSAVAYDQQGVGERSLFRRVWKDLCKGDICLGDSGFCSFGDFCRLLQRGVDMVTRLHGRRSTGRQVLRRFGKHERIVEWRRSGPPPSDMTRAEWDALPLVLLVREIFVVVEKPGFRTDSYWIATTLVDRKAYPARAFGQLYLQRWWVELYLKDIKESIGMSSLTCRTPQMVRKELTMYRLAYNLVRGLMLEATRVHGVATRRVSFASALATIRTWAPILALGARDDAQYAHLYARMLEALAGDPVPERPGRREPRATKQRPKNYPLLNKPRGQYQEIPHRNRYKAA